MRIALDYDKTFTADPQLWRGFIVLAKTLNHDVLIVTARRSLQDDAFIPLYGEVDMIVSTQNQPKRAFMERMGIKIDIWIDDRPESIV